MRVDGDYRGPTKSKRLNPHHRVPRGVDQLLGDARLGDRTHRPVRCCGTIESRAGTPRDSRHRSCEQTSPGPFPGRSCWPRARVSSCKAVRERKACPWLVVFVFSHCRFLAESAQPATYFIGLSDTAYRMAMLSFYILILLTCPYFPFGLNTILKTLESMCHGQAQCAADRYR